MLGSAAAEAADAERLHRIGDAMVDRLERQVEWNARMGNSRVPREVRADRPAFAAPPCPICAAVVEVAVSWSLDVVPAARLSCPNGHDATEAAHRAAASLGATAVGLRSLPRPAP